MELPKEFDGVFRFTNPTDEDFVVLWNNKEYLFPKQTTCPMIIPSATPEEVQEIRKKFAYKLAVREFYKGKDYARLSKLGGANPSTFDEKTLEPVIEMCLNPLPEATAKTKDMPKAETNLRSTKAIDDKFDAKADFEVNEK